ncbi:MAG TPA: SGNH/GDSL hydrolase family protein, partial [Acidimicrobiales bacterium]|nr:SGNH/GDSL hydrolase family protein [Acidimicrobiales bacterium]
MGRRFLAAGLGAALISGLLALVGPAPSASAAAPTPTPAKRGYPSTIAVIGDSISTATGTGELGDEVKHNSWVTGDELWSMRGVLGIQHANAFNVASNGRRMTHMDDMAATLPTNTQYVVVELGGNDLCRPSVGEMTSTTDYRNQFRAGLAAIRARVPNALIFVAGVPDIYNLWYLRGAPSSVNPHVADETGQEGQARLYWDNPLVDIIPCQSLLENPTSTSAADENRRQQVRARNQAFNAILQQECDAVLRCRHDGNHFFNFSSNRNPAPNGPYRPRNQWQFTDRDISHNRGNGEWLCPVAFTRDDCGDHFHPSIFGQQKLAQAGIVAGYQFAADGTMPTVALSPDRAPDGGGRYAGPVTVTINGSDDVGVRGYEVRVHQNGSVTPWAEHVGSAPPVTVTTSGQSYVEARALDVNGNLGASQILGVNVDPTAFGVVAGTVTHR